MHVGFKMDGGLQKYREYGVTVRPLLEKAGPEINANNKGK